MLSFCVGHQNVPSIKTDASELFLLMRKNIPDNQPIILNGGLAFLQCAFAFTDMPCIEQTTKL